MSIIYAINTGGAIAQNESIPLLINRRKCPIYELNGSGIKVLKDGYYKVNGTLTFSVPTVGEVGVGIYKDSTLIQGAISSLTAVTDTIYTLNVDGVFRVLCMEGKPTISLINTGVAITLTNASLTIQG